MSAKKVRTEQEYEDGQEMELRRGPWTVEEDTLLIHYIAYHGEGRWNLLARCSGLKRTGKSCRLRWLNYLKPDVKRGNLTPEEQMLILDLHSKWGNRWSRIAQHLPGRTDNEIKNYWRTRVQKHARQLKIDANSTLFRDAVRCFWMPSLMQKIPSSPKQQQQEEEVNNTQPVLRIEEDPRPEIPNHDLMAEFENYNSAVSLEMNTPQFDLGPESGGLLANDMHTGRSTVSDCPMMENNNYIDHSSSIEESLWSIWMNDSISSNPESYLSGESRS